MRFNMKFTADITVTPIQQMGGDHMVVAAAKVSHSGMDAMLLANKELEESNFGLINYLMKHRHGTPFEHSSMTFFVHAPIFVFREWHRHRIGFSYNEVSGRYSKLEPVFWIPRRYRPMIPSDKHKSARPDFVILDDDATYNEVIYDCMQLAYKTAWENYIYMIENMNIAKEVARAVLPVGIYSACWVTCNPRSLMAFLSLRTKDERAEYPSYPQMEIEEAARVCEETLAKGWPLTYKAFNDNGRVAP